jgi:hypothetical protein
MKMSLHPRAKDLANVMRATATRPSIVRLSVTVAAVPGVLGGTEKVKGRFRLQKTSNLQKCPLCGQTSSLNHIAAGCQVALDQGRYLWRHNRVLQVLSDGVSSHLGRTTEPFQVNTDIDNGSRTLPVEVFGHTRQRPDMVIILPVKKKITIMELTCPLPHNMDRWNTMKFSKYSPYLRLAEAHGWDPSLHTVAVSSNGVASLSLGQFLAALGMSQAEGAGLTAKCGYTSSNCTSMLRQAVFNRYWWPRNVLTGQGTSLEGGRVVR